jgi:hypothetical protein
MSETEKQMSGRNCDSCSNDIVRAKNETENLSMVIEHQL